MTGAEDWSEPIFFERRQLTCLSMEEIFDDLLIILAKLTKLFTESRFRFLKLKRRPFKFKKTARIKKIPVAKMSAIFLIIYIC
jgi:hypothetical protein